MSGYGDWADDIVVAVKSMRRAYQAIERERDDLREHLAFIGKQPCERGKGEVRCSDPMRGMDVTEYCLSCYAKAAVGAGEHGQ